MRRRVLDALAKRGTLVAPDAIELLCNQPNAIEIIENHLCKIETDSSMVISLNQLEETLRATGQIPIRDINIVTKISPATPKITTGYRLIKDITGNSTCIGDISNFSKLFQDRYKTIKRMLVRRRELQGAVSISRAKKSADKDVQMIGMVTSSKITKGKGHRIIELEDEEDNASILVLKDSKAFSDVVVNDEIIGVVGKPARNGGLIVASEIVRPDVPTSGGMQRTDSSSWAVFASDIHVGSSTFLEDQWMSFIDWLKTSKDAKDVRYLVLAGDLVDGIGIYPDQEDELVIDDVYKQYETLAEQLKGIRDDITIIASPGNHDAVRLAEPQPAFPDIIRKGFDSNVQFVGNPATVSLEDRKVLIYHGKSFDDWIPAIPGFSYDKPLEVMREMLRRRHLAPIYGDKTAIAPEEKDYLVVDDVPDIFVTGHIHKSGIGEYRGVIMINASTWQSQTSFQMMHNQVPDPCKVAMIHLGTGKIRAIEFN